MTARSATPTPCTGSLTSDEQHTGKELNREVLELEF